MTSIQFVEILLVLSLAILAGVIVIHILTPSTQSFDGFARDGGGATHDQYTQRTK